MKIVIIVSENESFDGTIMELNSDKESFYLVEKVFQNELKKDTEYSRKDLENMYGQFSYKELLFG